MKYFYLLCFYCISFILISCNSGIKKPPIDLTKTEIKKEVSLPYTEFNGLKTIPVKINGLSMDMIYDSGCSGVQLSLLELQTLYKNGKFSEYDFMGTSANQIADGSVVENSVIIIREIEIGGKDGIVLNNVEASVSPNLGAPVLLGNDVLDKVASVEVDNVHKLIKFSRN